MLFLDWLVMSDLYLFHLIVLLNPVLNCSKNALPFSVDKVTTGTYNFASAILNVAFVGILILITAVSTLAFLYALFVITQFSDHVKIRFISHLINLFQLTSYFNSTTKTVINHRFWLENAFQEILYMLDNWINEGSD